MERSLKRFAVGVIATGVVVVALPISSAAAINSTPCDSRTDIVKVTYNNGASSFCMANAGVTNRQFSNVTGVASGNNKIRFVSNGRTISMDKWQKKGILDGTPQRITRLRIL
ncbi:beta/gamma crystallin domain-containing protein [Streptomyces sp. NPDC002793]|uniref:beta/gamma crystallin domain-containing protein n=1 Tax=Streptomyces sp. NPDC002793 TaxID=3154432 RepID=UPI00331D4545